MLTDEQIEQLIALNEGRYSGIWTVEAESLDDTPIVRTASGEAILETGPDADGHCTAHFIAEATWAVPAMIEEIKALRAKLAQIESALIGIANDDGEVIEGVNRLLEFIREDVQ